MTIWTPGPSREGANLRKKALGRAGGSWKVNRSNEERMGAGASTMWPVQDGGIFFYNTPGLPACR